MTSTSSLAAPLSDKTLRICATDRVLTFDVAYISAEGLMIRRPNLTLTEHDGCIA